MKNIAIRTFVVALAVAGFSASSVYSASTARASQAKIALPQVGIKAPCAPGTTCGIDVAQAGIRASCAPGTTCGID